MPAATPYFEIDQISSGYKQHFSLQQVSFQLAKGTFAGIIGPNGAGKTTLFRAIANELPRHHGQVRLQGTNLATLSPRQRARRIAIVSQRLETADMLLGEYVLLGRMPYQSFYRFAESATDRRIAQHYLQLTGMAHLAHKNLQELSGGELQMASITRALCQEPELLLLDEPTSHLDITHALQVLNLIQRLNRQLGLTVLLIIHDLNLAGEYCDYLLLLHQGRLHTQGPPEHVLCYQHIEQVYGTVVVTQANPVSGKPMIIPVSERTLLQSKAHFEQRQAQSPTEDEVGIAP